LGITVNKERCYEMVKNSIGIVTRPPPVHRLQEQYQGSQGSP
jgi:aspartate ammonia-lyase